MHILYDEIYFFFLKSIFRLFPLPLKKTPQHNDNLWRWLGTQEKEDFSARYKNKIENQTHLVEMNAHTQH